MDKLFVRGPDVYITRSCHLGCHLFVHIDRSGLLWCHISGHGFEPCGRGAWRPSNMIGKVFLYCIGWSKYSRPGRTLIRVCLTKRVVTQEIKIPPPHIHVLLLIAISVISYCSAGLPKLAGVLHLHIFWNIYWVHFFSMVRDISRIYCVLPCFTQMSSLVYY